MLGTKNITRQVEFFTAHLCFNSKTKYYPNVSLKMFSDLSVVIIMIGDVCGVVPIRQHAIIYTDGDQVPCRQ